MGKTVSIRHSKGAYDIRVESGLLSSVGEWAKGVGGRAGKLVIISNKTVFDLYGDVAKASLTSAGYDVSVFFIGDGEKYKSFRTFEKTLDYLGANGFSRSDSVLALGGGVVGDLAGFAASVYLRGIGFLQVPTTLLAMIDSSVGGKTAVNTTNGKNLVGSFYQPAGVLIDPSVLKTLPQREVTAGLCEAVKQAALAGGKTFSGLREFLKAFPVNNFAESFADPTYVEMLSTVIRSQIDFKASIVRNDEREDLNRNDGSSRKILNFGHTLAHALEKVTAYKYLKHGEAVGYGIIFAAELSKKLELIDAYEVELLNDVVHRAGTLPPITHLDAETILESFKFDKKIVNDSLRWILLRGIGNPVIIPQNEIPHSLLVNSLERLINP